MPKGNPNRGVVLALHDATALHRWMEFTLNDRRFYNPIEAYEAKQAAMEATIRLSDKLIAIFQAHQSHDEATSPHAIEG